MRPSHPSRRFSSGGLWRGRRRTFRALVLATATTLGTLGVVFTGPAPASAATFSVEQKNVAFNPADITIGVGDTVNWTNAETDGTVHSVVQSGGGEINSPDMPPGATFSHTFTAPGTVNITCRFHPDMFMSVHVGGTPPTTLSLMIRGPP